MKWNGLYLNISPEGPLLEPYEYSNEPPCCTQSGQSAPLPSCEETLC